MYQKKGFSFKNGNVFFSETLYEEFKGTVSIISRNLTFQEEHLRFTTVPY